MDEFEHFLFLYFYYFEIISYPFNKVHGVKWRVTIVLFKYFLLFSVLDLYNHQKWWHHNLK